MTLPTERTIDNPGRATVCLQFHLRSAQIHPLYSCKNCTLDMVAAMLIATGMRQAVDWIEWHQADKQEAAQSAYFAKGYSSVLSQPRSLRFEVDMSNWEELYSNLAGFWVSTLHISCKKRILHQLEHYARLCNVLGSKPAEIFAR